MKITVTAGAVGDAVRGASAALAGGRADVVIDSIADSSGNTLGPVPGAVLGGFTGGTGNYAIGVQLGEGLNHYVLVNNL